MKCAILLLSVGIMGLVGCNFTNVVELPTYHLTSTELKEQEVRQKNMILYKEYLGSQGQLVTDQPYDVIQQMVYSTIPEKEEVYNVSLYLRTEPVVDPTYLEVLGESPQMEYVAVTSESELPQNILDNLSYGYYGIELDGMSYILEVLHTQVNLGGWEESYDKMVKLEEE